MSVNTHSHGAGDSTPPFSQPFHPGDRARPGLAALLRASTYAKDADLDVWDFALEIDELKDLGLRVSDLRWLVAKKYAEHGTEVSKYGDTHRSFEKGTGLNFEARTCLVLTGDGAAFATGALEDSRSADPGGMDDDAFPPGIDPGDEDLSGEELPPLEPSGEMNLLPLANNKPHWHAARRELLFGDVLVKKFRVPARNQEWILSVFEEDGWPEHIDDPLPRSADICPKARLHDAINRLNHKQVNPVLRFHGNGNGNGLYREPLAADADATV